MRWIALAPSNSTPGTAPDWPEGGRRRWCWWALGFTPRVCVLDDALLLEVRACERLWGGRAGLLRRLTGALGAVGRWRLACAPTVLAALAALRSLPEPTVAHPVAVRDLADEPAGWMAALDRLPLATAKAMQVHQDTLDRLGCTTWGQLRALPRAGVARRWGASVLDVLDRAYGLRPEPVGDWVRPPEHLTQDWEWAVGVTDAQHLLSAVATWWPSLRAWLQARRSGLVAFRLAWRYDAVQRHGWGEEAITVATTAPTQDTRHLHQLLAERLAMQVWPAPVASLRWSLVEAQPLPEAATSWWSDVDQVGQSWPHTLERLQARLGAHAVLSPHPQDDHRPERQVDWRAAVGSERPAHAQPAWPSDTVWHPPWLLRQPRRLPVRDGRPCCGGVLTLLAGPHRLETAWWSACGVGAGEPCRRDYYLALSPRSGLLWVYREASLAEVAWYWHGCYG